MTTALIYCFVLPWVVAMMLQVMLGESED